MFLEYIQIKDESIMKIVCLIDGLGLGGAQRQLIGLTQGLCEKQYDAELVYYDPSHFYLDTVKNIGLNYKYIDAPKNKIGKLVTIFRYLNQNKPNCVISYMDGASIISCLYKIFNPSVKLIVSERNTTQKLNIRSRIQFFLYRFADLIIPNSYTQYNYISNRFPRLISKTIAITNFTDVSHFSPKFDAKLNDCPIILTVGRIAPQKNVINYIRAISDVKSRFNGNFKIRWVGNITNKEYYEECLDLIREFKLENVLEFKPQTTSIINEYYACDIFCLPSLYEGFPNALCEAIACGLPVMCSNICDNAVIVNYGANGLLFDPKSVNSMSSAILTYLKMPYDKLCDIGMENRKYAVERFSYDNFIGKYISCIEKIM